MQKCVLGLPTLEQNVAPVVHAVTASQYVPTPSTFPGSPGFPQSDAGELPPPSADGEPPLPEVGVGVGSVDASAGPLGSPGSLDPLAPPVAPGSLGLTGSSEWSPMPRTALQAASERLVPARLARATRTARFA